VGKPRSFMYRPETLLVAQCADDVAATITRVHGSDMVELLIISGDQDFIESSVHQTVKSARARAFEVMDKSVQWKSPGQV